MQPWKTNFLSLHKLAYSRLILWDPQAKSNWSKCHVVLTVYLHAL